MRQGGGYKLHEQQSQLGDQVNQTNRAINILTFPLSSSAGTEDHFQTATLAH